MSLFINGAEVAATLSGQVISNMADNDTPVNIGRIESFSGSFVGPAAFFHGLIDEVSIYARALSESEIQAIYDAGSDGKCKGDEPTPTSTATSTATATTTPAPESELYLPAILNPLLSPTPTPTPTVASPSPATFTPPPP